MKGLKGAIIFLGGALAGALGNEASKCKDPKDFAKKISNNFKDISKKVKSVPKNLKKEIKKEK